MQCPQCGQKMKVYKTREDESKFEVKRYRYCTCCGCRVTTVETLEYPKRATPASP